MTDYIQFNKQQAKRLIDTTRRMENTPVGRAGNDYRNHHKQNTIFAKLKEDLKYQSSATAYPYQTVEGEGNYPIEVSAEEITVWACPSMATGNFIPKDAIIECCYCYGYCFAVDGGSPQITFGELKEELRGNSSADAYQRKWNGSAWATIDTITVYPGPQMTSESSYYPSGTKFWAAYQDDRWVVLSPWCANCT